MKIGPKYKIARRLGAPIFEKTQNQKFSLIKKGKEGARPKAKSDFGRQMNEKQKARFMYGITERQFSKYVKQIIEKKTPNGNNALFESLERRLDNVAYRAGLASTRSGARQMVSHGHLMVDGVKVTIPSYKVTKGEVITVREASIKKPLFITLDEKMKEISTPAWIALDISKKTWTISGLPKIEGESLLFDPGAVFEYYRR